MLLDECSCVKCGEFELTLWK